MRLGKDVNMSEASAGERMVAIPVGVVVRRMPGATRWRKWAWQAVALLPGAGRGGWRELRRDGDTVEYHAATADLQLHRTETEAYLVSLNGKPPSIYVIMRHPDGVQEERPELVTVTASAYEAQDYADNGEDIVEPVPMPPGLEAWIADFVQRHHKDEVFVKRKRRPHMDERTAEGIGDARIRQPADVYRAPGTSKVNDR
jgi:hypothetical protein